MKYLDEYRDGEITRRLLDEVARTVTRPWTMMEVCGGQTHSILKSGLDTLLPPQITLIHGPGCPVCVTPLELVDKAVAIASRPNVILTSYGDMLRVPGSSRDLFSVKAQGGDVRIVYSPLDALKIAQDNPEREVVFFAVGFETTAPANAMSVFQAKRQGINNYSVLVSHVTVPPVLAALLESDDVQVDAFLAPGHVNAVMGYWEYEQLVARYRVPMVVTGFEPVDLVRGILMVVRQLEEGRAEVENAYTRAVTREGNVPGQQLVSQVFELCDRKWRGIGVIPMSGYRLRDEYLAYDAERRFPDVAAIETQESSVCISGQILKGIRKPVDCPAFGKECTPQTPLGATMVSSEGACAAYYRYGRFERAR
ncbi:MAG: hydrogenase formation protein HypD [Chloroflexi bacterium]|jgi:hydrogenase expression/formation protein HypD|nr:hydrogenase formation protein HypD [Chloroflexota bacterium]MDL1882889.1 hydrogenase formation protein HypD [Anaerolineae bacterium CFX8]